MTFFNRLKNIIRSNINVSEDINLDEIEEKYNKIFNENNIEQSKPEYTIDEKAKEYYRVLELEYGAGFEEIRGNFKKLLKKYHPDLYVNNPEKLKMAQEKTKKLNEAYSYFLG